MFSGQGQRRHPVDRLAGDGQRLPAGRDHMRFRAPPQDRLGDLGAAADQVLAVIQHDQDVLRRQRIGQRVQHVPARLRRDPQRPGDSRRDPVLVSDRGQLGQPHPVPGPIQQPCGHLQAQPGLARSRRRRSG